MQLCSQPVEGGGHRLHTLKESLTEDDTCTDQSDAARDGGGHHSQDQGHGELTLGFGVRRSCSRTETFASSMTFQGNNVRSGDVRETYPRR